MGKIASQPSSPLFRSRPTALTPRIGKSPTPTAHAFQQESIINNMAANTALNAPTTQLAVLLSCLPLTALMIGSERGA